MFKSQVFGLKPTSLAFTSENANGQWWACQIQQIRIQNVQWKGGFGLTMGTGDSVSSVSLKIGEHKVGSTWEESWAAVCRHRAPGRRWHLRMGCHEEGERHPGKLCPFHHSVLSQPCCRDHPNRSVLPAPFAEDTGATEWTPEMSAGSSQEQVHIDKFILACLKSFGPLTTRPLTCTLGQVILSSVIQSCPVSFMLLVI